MKIRILILLILFSLKITLHAESLHDTALQILTQSPEFTSQNYSLESIFSNLRTESNLPDPELSGEYLWLPKDVDNRWALQLEWGVEWPGVYRARGNEAGKKMTVAEKTIYAQRVEKLAEIKDLLLDYIQCVRKLQILEELNQNNDTIYKLSEQAARGGEITVLDLNKIRLEYANIRAARANLLDEKSNVTTSLSQIYGKDCKELLSRMDCVFPPLTLPSSEEIAAIREMAPSVKAAVAEAEAMRQARKVTKMEALPSLSLGYKHAFEDGMHFNGAVFGISIPMFSSRGKQKAAKADIMEAENKVEATGKEIEAEAMQTYHRLGLLKQQIDEIAPIIENADYNDALLKAYKGGVITIIEYIADRNYFTNAAVELVGLRLSAAKAQAQLQKYLIESDL